MTKLMHATVLITGASSGIGRAVAERLGDQASTVAITGRRAELLEDTARTIRAKGSRCLTYPGDETRPGSAREKWLPTSWPAPGASTRRCSTSVWVPPTTWPRSPSRTSKPVCARTSRSR